jgi:hypothetical protein
MGFLRLMRLPLIIALLLAGCAERPVTEPSRDSHKSPPSSSYEMDAVVRDASRWVNVDTTRRGWVHVAGTGSMLPMFGANSVLLLERTDGTDLRVGDVALYDREDRSGTIAHRVRVVGDTAVIFTGDNNPGDGSDGWIAKSRIRWRVAGLLYSSRP